MIAIRLLKLKLELKYLKKTKTIQRNILIHARLNELKFKLNQKQKHHLEGNAIPAGQWQTQMLLYASGVRPNYNVNSNYTSIWHNSAADFFAFWKISAANSRILWHQLPTELRNLQRVIKHSQYSNRGQNSVEIHVDPILPQAGTELTKKWRF